MATNFGLGEVVGGAGAGVVNEACVGADVGVIGDDCGLDMREVVVVPPLLLAASPLV